MSYEFPTPPINEPDNEPENVPQPEQGSEQMPLYASERSLEEQKLHIEKMNQLAYELGFVSTSALDALRGDVKAWVDAVEKMIADMGKISSDVGMNLYVGQQIALASIFYERRDAESYFKVMEELEEFLLEGQRAELLQKVQTLI